MERSVPPGWCLDSHPRGRACATGRVYAAHGRSVCGRPQQRSRPRRAHGRLWPFPWLRHRLLTEDEPIAAALAAHGPRRAEKFVQEVMWRAYWKGWLEQRPTVWHDYREGVADALPDAAGDVAAVAAGRTGIACMDSWAQELVQTGYLHNHARMWFASI